MSAATMPWEVVTQHQFFLLNFKAVSNPSYAAVLAISLPTLVCELLAAVALGLAGFIGLRD